MNLKYSNACKEVLVLFDYFLDENDLSKIPEKQIEYLRQNANQQYIYFVDETKELEEQEMSKEAKAIIISLYKKYFANKEQRKKIDEIVSIMDKQGNIKKTNNSGFNNLDEVLKQKNVVNDNEEIKTNGDIEIDGKSLVKAESIWKKIINKISKFFRLK